MRMNTRMIRIMRIRSDKSEKRDLSSRLSWNPNEIPKQAHPSNQRIQHKNLDNYKNKINSRHISKKLLFFLVIFIQFNYDLS
jgi:hypothetical protein